MVSLRAVLKTRRERRVRARGLQRPTGIHFSCRPGAPTGRVFKTRSNGVGAGADSHEDDSQRRVNRILPPSRRPAIRPSELRIGTTTVRVSKSNQILLEVAEWILKRGKTLPR